MTSSVSDCDTKNTDLSKLGSYQISDNAQYTHPLNLVAIIEQHQPTEKDAYY